MGTPIALSVIGSTGKVTVPVLSLSIVPDNPELPDDNELAFIATATFADSTVDIVTSESLWTSTDTTVATINSAGIAVGRSLGTTLITATLEGVVSEPETLTVVVADQPPALIAGSELTVDQDRNVTITWVTGFPITAQVLQQ